MGYDRQRAEFRQYQRDQQHLYRDLNAHHLWHGPGAGAGALAVLVISLAVSIAQLTMWVISKPVRFVLERRQRRSGE